MRRAMMIFGLAAALLAAAPAEARNNGFYAFADGQRVLGYQDNPFGFDAGLGYAFTKHTAVELSYIRGFGDHAGNGAALDLIARAPLRNSFGLFATAGGEYANILGKQKFGARVGGGLEFSPIEDITLRLGARYRSVIASGLTVNAGIAVKLW